MKKLLFLLLLLMPGVEALAQEIKIAPVFGPNVSFPGYSKELRTLLKDDLSDLLEDAGVSSRVNILPAVRVQVGGLVDYSFSEALSLQTGLLFNLRGYTFKMKAKGPSGTAKMSSKIRASYLELPLWGKYQVGESGFIVSFGPTLGIALSGKTHTQVTADGESDSETESLSIGSEEGLDNLKRLDVSLNLGVAKQISIGENPLEVSLNIQPSLTKWSVTGNSEYYGRYVTVGVRVAYFISLK